ncbi:MAG: signal peptidase I [Bacilli bacterium]|nr:signal peptidase I [Bacilli bacterium]
MKTFKKILKVLGICLLVIILAINISIILQAKSNPNKVPSIFGYKPFIVLSGSMESEIQVGDLVLVKEVDTSTLKENDIIAFRDKEDVVTTHRITKVIDGKDGMKSFVTKGDANNAEDGEINSTQVEGLYQKRFPKLGNAVMFIQKPVGFAVVVLSIFIVCLLVFMFQNRRINKEIKFENEEERKAFEEFKKSREKLK